MAPRTSKKSDRTGTGSDTAVEFTDDEFQYQPCADDISGLDECSPLGAEIRRVELEAKGEAFVAHDDDMSVFHRRVFAILFNNFLPSLASLSSPLFPGITEVRRCTLQRSQDNPRGPPLAAGGWLNGELVNFLIQ